MLTSRTASSTPASRTSSCRRAASSIQCAARWSAGPRREARCRGWRRARPWGGSAANSDLGREAGLDDIAGGRGGGGGSQRAGLFDTAQNDDDAGDDDSGDDGDSDDGGFDGGDSDTA